MGSVVSSVFKGIGSVLGMGNSGGYTIAQDPEATRAATAQANLSADLASDNTPTIESGGQASSTSSTSTSRRKRTTTGVASNLGIGNS